MAEKVITIGQIIDDALELKGVDCLRQAETCRLCVRDKVLAVLKEFTGLCERFFQNGANVGFDDVVFKRSIDTVRILVAGIVRGIRENCNFS